MKRVTAVLLMLTLMPNLANSADAEGNFAVKGAGITTCQRFLDEREKDSNLYFLYAGWVNGYLTASNQFTADTFDITPWENTDLLAAMLANHCNQNREIPFVTAVRAMLHALHKDRLTTSSRLVQAKADDKSMNIYQEMVRRMQRKLEALGHYSGGVDGIYGPGTQGAIRAFQEKENLPPTGLPDQLTLLKLLR